MGFIKITFVIATVLGGSMYGRPGFAQSQDAAVEDAAGIAAMSMQACRERLAARHLTFSFTPPVVDGDCSIPLPVRLRSLAIDGNEIAFAAEPILDCRLAERLADWIGNVVAPLARHHLGSGLGAIETGSGYACRRRNNQASGKLSEHAKGNALDIAAFALSDGRRLAVRSDDERPPAVAAFFAAVRTTACGYFLTVLGPGSDAAHEQHLHLDLGPESRSPNYRICE